MYSFIKDLYQFFDYPEVECDYPNLTPKELIKEFLSDKEGTVEYERGVINHDIKLMINSIREYKNDLLTIGDSNKEFFTKSLNKDIKHLKWLIKYKYKIREFHSASISKIRT